MLVSKSAAVFRSILLHNINMLETFYFIELFFGTKMPSPRREIIQKLGKIESYGSLHSAFLLTALCHCMEFQKSFSNSYY